MVSNSVTMENILDLSFHSWFPIKVQIAQHQILVLTRQHILNLIQYVPYKGTVWMEMADFLST